jgi:hypothetical protein
VPDDGQGMEMPPEGLPPLGPYWIVAGLARGTTPALRVFPFDGTKLATPCAEQGSSSPAYAIRELVHHPSLRRMYAVTDGIHALNVHCATPTTFSGISAATGVREKQQIVQDPATGNGFFTGGGAGAINVYRFTSTPTDGTPALGGDANGPGAGALAFDAATQSVFAAGELVGRLDQFTLAANQMLPANPTSMVAICMKTVRLHVTGSNHLLAFCNDDPNIRRFTRSPFATAGNVGNLGMVDQAVSLPGDRVIVSRAAPKSDLVIVRAEGGEPTFPSTPGPVIASRVFSMGASQDGKLVATARVVDFTKAELEVWRIDGNVVTIVDKVMVDASITAIGITTPDP